MIFGRFGSAARAGIRAATNVPEPTVASAKPSVGDQALIGGDDGVAPKAGLFGQRARRRQRLAGFHQAADDHLAQCLIQPVRRRGGGRDVRTGEVERQLGLGRRRDRIGRNFLHGIGTIADQTQGYNCSGIVPVRQERP
ncbi:hypothetical protein ACVWWG_006868 [Bradyrhizobium sp. LB7.2]